MLGAIWPLQDDLFCTAGRIFCNLKGLTANQGDNVRFYVMALGDEVRVRVSTACVPLSDQARRGQRKNLLRTYRMLLNRLCLRTDPVICGPGLARIACCDKGAVRHLVTSPDPYPNPKFSQTQIWTNAVAIVDVMQVDIHTAGATSTTFSLDEQNSDIISVFPGVMDTGDSLQSQPGECDAGLVH